MFTFFLTAPLLAFCRIVKISRSNLPKVSYQSSIMCRFLLELPPVRAVRISMAQRSPSICFHIPPAVKGLGNYPQVTQSESGLPAH